MKKLLTSFFLLLALCCFSQNHQSLDTVKAPDVYENIFAKKLYADSLATSTVIFIKNEVKAHKHVTHSEHVYVLEGEGEMIVGDKKFKIKKGDIVFIPKGTAHSLKVTSTSPAKVLSIQAPMFDGKDRIMIEEPK